MIDEVILFVPLSLKTHAALFIRIVVIAILLYIYYLFFLYFRCASCSKGQTAKFVNAVTQVKRF